MAQSCSLRDLCACPGFKEVSSAKSLQNAGIPPPPHMPNIHALAEATCVRLAFAASTPLFMAPLSEGRRV